MTLAGLYWLASGAVASLVAARGQALADQAATVVLPRRRSTPRSRPRRQAWPEAEAAYARAARLDPLDPDYRQGLARVIEIRAARLPPGGPDARSS